MLVRPNGGDQTLLTQGDIGPDDIRPLREAGVSEEAIEDALYVCAYLNLLD